MKDLVTMTLTEQNKILQAHELWLAGLPGGVKADFTKINLNLVDLEGVDLRTVDLKEANLWGACLRKANLSGVDLKGANLSMANLQEANLRGACLVGANLKGATLWESDIREAIGNGKEIKTLQFEEWTVTWTDTEMAINDIQHPLKYWEKVTFALEEPSKEDLEFLEFWKKWKPILKEIGCLMEIKGENNR